LTAIGARAKTTTHALIMTGKGEKVGTKKAVKRGGLMVGRRDAMGEERKWN